MDRELEEYQLAFNLPDHLESWISEYEEHRASRTRAVKQQFLSDIVIYRMEGDSLQTFQLHYQPGDLNRRRRSHGCACRRVKSGPVRVAVGSGCCRVTAGVCAAV